MGRIAEILTRVQDSLADAGAKRYSQARLLRLVDEAQKDIVKKAKLLRTNEVVSVVAEYNTYKLDAPALKITRVVNIATGAKLTVRSHEEMDELYPGWEDVTGTEIECIVFNHLEPNQFKVYPIPAITDGGETFVISDFGVVTAVEGDIVDGDFGVVVSVTTNATKTQKFSSVFGVVTGMVSVEADLRVYFLRQPSKINAVDTPESSLEIDQMFDKAIKHYVIGEALTDDKDTLSVSLGERALQKYYKEVEEATGFSGSNFMRTQQHNTTYRGGLEE